MLRNGSKAALQSQSGSINEQIKAFLKNDPSATHLGDIGTIFGGGSDHQMAHSVNRLGTLSKHNASGASTMASSVIKKPSKL